LGEAAFVVMLAGPGAPVADVIRAQTQLLATQAGYATEQKNQLMETGNAMFKVLLTEKDDQKAIAQLREIAKNAKVKPPLAADLGSAGDFEAELKLYVSPWYRYQIAYDPHPVLAKLRCPVLAINGEIDPVMSPQLNLPAVHRALGEGGNPDYTVMQLPRLNHLFQTTRTGNPIEYRQLEETFAPLALRTVADWVLARVGNRE
jgi:pimeloyl-ACP methyl ester carboxylesterase